MREEPRIYVRCYFCGRDRPHRDEQIDTPKRRTDPTNCHFCGRPWTCDICDEDLPREEEGINTPARRTNPANCKGCGRPFVGPMSLCRR